MQDIKRCHWLSDSTLSHPLDFREKQKKIEDARNTGEPVFIIIIIIIIIIICILEEKISSILFNPYR